jgi:short-subunit dehydrogenase
MVFEADVADAAAVDAAVQAVLSAWGRIDLTITSAGVAGYGMFPDVPADVFNRIIAINLLGTANVIRSVLPSMRARNEGAIVALGSVIGYIASPQISAYATSKWGVRILVRTVQIENRDRPGVHISHLAPGGVDTGIYRRAANYSDREGKPLPPVLSPDTVAAAAFRLADRRRRTAHVGAANLLIVVGYTLLPGVYDWLVSPLFRLLASRRSANRNSHPGNVFSS